jgi:hypothetical protein
MPRMIGALASTIVFASAAVHAQPNATVTTTTAQEEIGDQNVGATTGIATGGRVTAGGLRLDGHYLYQLSDQDWFDGTAAFTVGGGDPVCFRDRMDATVCRAGIAVGSAFELQAGVRRYFTAQGIFRPFVRAAIGISYTRFRGDDVGGVSFPLHAGGGIRARVAPSVAIVALGELAFGVGRFGDGLGAEPQFGLVVTAGAEFRL